MNSEHSPWVTPESEACDEVKTLRGKKRDRGNRRGGPAASGSPSELQWRDAGKKVGGVFSAGGPPWEQGLHNSKHLLRTTVNRWHSRLGTATEIWQVKLLPLTSTWGFTPPSDWTAKRPSRIFRKDWLFPSRALYTVVQCVQVSRTKNMKEADPSPG